MKMRNLIMAVIALVVTVSGCQKIDSPMENEGTKAVFTISDRPDFSGNLTKAVKSEWANGDWVVFVFKPTGENWYGGTLGGTPYIKAAYTVYSSTTGWSEIVLNNTITSDLGEGGEWMAIHHRGEMLTHGTKDETYFMKGTNNVGNWFDKEGTYPLLNYNGGEFMKGTGTYTVTDGVVSLGSVTLNIDPRLFQISVPRELSNMPSGHDEAYMEESTISIVNSTTGANWAVVALKKDVLSFNPTETHGFVFDRSTATGDAGCVVNGEDISYCFAFKNELMIKKPTSSWAFHVRYKTSSEYYKYELLVPVTDKTIAVGTAYRLPGTGWTVTESDSYI